MISPAHVRAVRTFLARQLALSAGRCERKRRCDNRATRIFYLADSEAIDVGSQAHMLVALCDRCSKECLGLEPEDSPDDFIDRMKSSDVMSKAFFLVAGFQRVQGRSNFSIGFWFKDRLKRYAKLRESIRQLLIRAGLYNSVREIWEEADLRQRKPNK